MEDMGVALAWLLTVVAAFGCVVYGLWKWNRGGEKQ